MLIYSMGVSVDGFTADRDGDFQWSVPTDEQFTVHLEEVRSLGVHLCGRKLYETMLVWETDPSMRDDELQSAFADAWTALPKVVFSRTLDSVEGAHTTLAREDLRVQEERYRIGAATILGPLAAATITLTWTWRRLQLAHRVRALRARRRFR